MNSDRSYGKTGFQDVTIRSTDKHSIYRSPQGQAYRNVRIPVKKRERKFYRWLRNLLPIGTAAVLSLGVAHGLQEDPETLIGNYIIKTKHIPELKILTGVSRDDIWVGPSDLKDYSINIFTDTSRITNQQLIPEIRNADTDPKDFVLTDAELQKYYKETMDEALKIKH